ATQIRWPVVPMPAEPPLNRSDLATALPAAPQGLARAPRELKRARPHWARARDRKSHSAPTFRAAMLPAHRPAHSSFVYGRVESIARRLPLTGSVDSGA